MFKHEPTHKVVLGLGYGDEGKGMAVAHEVARALAFGLRPIVVRFNGGPQAAHNVRVQTDDGNVMHHTHSQFGSGALLGAKTILAKGMLFDPLAVAREASHLSFVTKRDVMPDLMVDKACPVVLPIHAYANQQLERIRGNERHGSTGRGIGVARACEHACKTGLVDRDMLIDVRSLFNATELNSKMRFWCEWISKQFHIEVDVPIGGFADDMSDGMRRLVWDGRWRVPACDLRRHDRRRRVRRGRVPPARHGSHEELPDEARRRAIAHRGNLRRARGGQRHERMGRQVQDRPV